MPRLPSALGLSGACSGAGVAHLKLRRRLCNGNGTGGEDMRIGKLWVEAHWAAMDDSRGSGKAKDI
eukprot:scaffold7077_cov137-Isochrysis_galbana.AAC.2